MSVTEIIHNSSRLHEAVMNSMIQKDCLGCGCEQCKQILEVMQSL